MEVKKEKWIEWKKGSGSVIIGLVMVFGAAIFIFTLVYQCQLFNASVHSQIVTDVVIDGATLYAQEIFGVDDAKFNEMATRLLNENEAVTGVDYEIESLEMEPTNVRSGYEDTIVSMTVTGTHSNSYQFTSSAKVLAYSFTRTDSEMTEQERQILQYFINRLPENSVQRKALEYVVSEGLLHKMYGGNSWEGKELITVYFPQRLGPDTYDCSGFVSTAYSSGAGLDYYITSSMIPDMDYYHTGMDGIKTGDVIKYPGHTAIYLGVLPEDLSLSLGITPGTALQIDSQYESRGILSTSPAGGMGPYGTNWGVQIRAVTSNGEGYCDIDQYNAPENKVTAVAAPAS